MNQIIIAGRLGLDPQLRHAESGTAVLRLRVAVNERVKSGQQWTDHTEWFTAVAFGARAEGLATFIEKGHAVIVVGKLRQRQYTGRDGEERLAVEVIADDVKVIGGGQPRRSEQRHYDDPTNNADTFGDDDIPF